MVAIIVPAYNEEGRILRTLKAYSTEFSGDFTLTVVMNGCTDKTLEVLENFQKEYPSAPVKVQRYDEPIGKGGALRKGFAQAENADYVGFVDADLATPVKDFEKLLRTVKEKHVDGAIASRLKKGSVVKKRGIIRTAVSHIFASLVRLVTDLDFEDTQCGAKVFSREAMKKILPELTMSDMTIDVDMLLAARKHNLKIEEVPTEWADQSSSAMLGSPMGLLKSGMRMFRSLLDLQKKYNKS